MLKLRDPVVFRLSRALPDPNEKAGAECLVDKTYKSARDELSDGVHADGVGRWHPRLTRSMFGA
eukprot:scaffold269390_cov39-Tisochrysis_lutea.AAC.4